MYCSFYSGNMTLYLERINNMIAYRELCFPNSLFPMQVEDIWGRKICKYIKGYTGPNPLKVKQIRDI